MSRCNDCGPFTIAEGDTLPVLQDALAEDDEVPEGLDGATVTFVARHRMYEARVEKAATVVDADKGWVDVSFATTDLQAGEYDYQYVVVIGLTRLIFPNTGPRRMLVTRRL